MSESLFNSDQSLNREEAYRRLEHWLPDRNSQANLLLRLLQDDEKPKGTCASHRTPHSQNNLCKDWKPV